MLAILPHIEYLLRRNDCVILPGFGAFVVHYTPAVVSQTGVLMPPSRSVGFNPLLNINDGLLANSIMRRSKVSYDRAIRTIADNVKELRELLDAQSRVQFGRLGSFYTNEENTVCFEPNVANCASFSDFYGFGNLKLRTLEELNNAQAETTRKADVVYLPISRSIFKFAAMIAVAIILTITLSTPVVMDQSVDYAGMRTEIKQKPQETFVPQVKVEEKVEQPVAVAKDEAKEEISEPKDMYYVVVATLRTLDQAKQFVEESQMQGLQILDNKRSVYRVYVASGESYKDVYDSTYSKLKETNPDIWIYKYTN